MKTSLAILSVVVALISIILVSFFVLPVSQYIGWLLIITIIIGEHLILYWESIMKRDMMSSMWIYYILNSTLMYVAIGNSWVKSNLTYFLVVNSYVLIICIALWTKHK